MSLNPNEETKSSDEIESKYLSANVNFATNIDWTSPNRSIKFLDGFYHFRDIPGQSNQSVVFDVKAVEFVGGKMTLWEAGWTIVPIFKKHDRKMYVKSGYY